MPSSSTEPPGPGPAQAAAMPPSASATPTPPAVNTLLSPRQRALLEASDEPDLGSLSLSSTSSTAANNSHGVHLDLATILASERVYKDVAATSYPCSVGKALSQEDESNRPTEANLTYGEIPFRSMAFILEKIRQDYGKPRPAEGDNQDEEEEDEESGVMQEPGKDVLYDIGSGTGKPCFAAAAIFPFRKVVGIEVLGSLHEAALKIKNTWEVEAVPALAAARGGGMKGGEEGAAKTMTTQLEFLQGDFRDMTLCDWPSKADVCVANSTCFSSELMLDLAGLAAGMRKGSVFVTLTKRLPSPDWETVDDTLMMMSWGGATVYTQRKKTPPCPRIN